MDLSLFEKPAGKEALVKQLEHAVRNVGKAYHPKSRRVFC